MLIFQHLVANARLFHCKPVIIEDDNHAPVEFSTAQKTFNWVLFPPSISLILLLPSLPLFDHVHWTKVQFFTHLSLSNQMYPGADFLWWSTNDHAGDTYFTCTVKYKVVAGDVQDDIKNSCLINDRHISFHTPRPPRNYPDASVWNDVSQTI